MAILESSVDPLSVFGSTDDLARLIADRANWICAIDTGRGTRGTGLLVGPDLVLTNFHVVEGLFASAEAARAARCRFDFRTDPDSGEENGGRWIDFAADWCVAKSPYSAKDKKGARTGFAGDELDYAIIRLAEPAGDLPVRDTGSAARGWMAIPDRAGLPEPRSTIYVFQHPVAHPDRMTGRQDTMPQKWTDGAVIEYLDTDLRMRHTATTFKGSSGAPCFDSKYRLVALHHAGDKTSDIADYGEWNQAVPVEAIVRHLRARGQESLIGRLPPARRPAAVGPVTGTVALGTLSEDAIEQRLWAASILMDRDAVEDRVGWTRDSRNANRGIVHVLACRQVDKHQNFIRRLSLLTSDEQLDAKQKRRLAFLGEGSSEMRWRQENIEWHADQPEDVALDLISNKLRAIAQMPGRTIAVASVAVGDAKIAREKRLVPAVAALCGTVSDADRLQLFVVYYDAAAKPEADKFAARRRDLGALWPLRESERPPGCGVCALLEDVDNLELNAWCDALQMAWKITAGRLTSVVDAVFAQSPKLPILNVENGIKPDLRRLIAARS